MPTILISGGNRGIGLGLAEHYAALPDHTLIMALRNPDSMPDVKCGQGSRVITVKCDAGVSEDALKAIEEIKTKHNIDKLDIVIANAAIMDTWDICAKIPLDVFEQHWRVNVLGALALYQATVPLIPSGGKFVYMSSGAGIIDRVPDKPDAAYGITKFQLNYLARWGHFENPDIVVFALSPGWVQTAAVLHGSGKASITLDESIEGCVKRIDEATRDKWSGVHVNYDGEQRKW